MSQRIMLLALALTPWVGGCGSSEAVKSVGSEQPVTEETELAKLKGVWELVNRAHDETGRPTFGERYEFGLFARICG